MSKGRALDARGVSFDEVLLAEVAAAISNSQCPFVRLEDARFTVPLVLRGAQLPALYARGARFEAGVDLRAVVFDGHVSFSSTHIEGNAQFTASTFSDGLDLMGTRATGSIKLGWDLPAENGLKDPARIHGDLLLEQTHVAGSIDLGRVLIEGGLAASELVSLGRFTAGELSVGDLLDLRHARIGGTLYARGIQARRVYLRLGRFESDVILSESVIEKELDVGETQVGGDLDLARAHLEDGRRIGPVYARGKVDLSGFSANRRLSLVVGAKSVRIRNGIFPAGVAAQVRWAEVDLSGSDLSAASTITTHHPGSPSKYAVRLGDSSESAVETWETFLDPASPSPHSVASIVEMHGADVSGLALADVDLSTCSFSGALRLSDLTIGPSCNMPTTRDLPGHRRWWTPRRTIHDECDARRALSGGHQPPEAQASPSRVADVYRELRRAREQRGDQPGASDFYYGEMEMRRRASDSIPERLILTLYWLLSGYGLKASRAIAALAVLLVVGALALDQIHPPLTGVEAAITSVELAIALAPDLSGLPHSIPARITRIAMRLIGPILIALAVVAIRERVKR